MTLQGNYRSSRRIINLYQNFQVQAELVPIEARGNYSELAGNIHYHRNVSLEYLPNFISEIVKSYVSNNILPEEICIIAPHWHFLANISRAVLGHLTDISLNAPGISPLPRNLDNFWLKVARLALTQPSPKLSRSRLRWANELLRDIVNGFKLPQEVQTGETLLQIINKISLFEDDGIKYLEIFFIEFEKLMKVPFSEINFFTEAKKQFLNAARKKRDDPKFESVPKNIAGFRKVFQPKQGVFLSSCHGIKGEEYEVVIAFGCLEDFIPHWQEKSNREVANRLLYVMASRAKQHLHFISETGHFDKSRNEKQPTQELVNLEFDFDKYY